MIFELLVSVMVQAEDVKVPTIDNPPFGIYKGEEVDGIGPKVTRDLLTAAQTKGHFFKISPTRIKELTNEKNVVFPFFTRSKDRENDFVWVGKITKDQFCVAVEKSKNPGLTADGTKNLKSICVAKGGITETVWTQAGYKNLDSAQDTHGCMRKLYGGAATGVATSTMSFKFIAKALGKNPDELECVGNLGEREYWVAATKGTSAADIEKLKSAYAEMEKTGKVQAAIDSIVGK